MRDQKKDSRKRKEKENRKDKNKKSFTFLKKSLEKVACCNEKSFEKVCRLCKNSLEKVVYLGIYYIHRRCD